MTQSRRTDNELRSRIDRLRIRLSGRPADAILVSHLPDVRYLCGFTGSNAVLLVTANSATLFTDGRYTIQAKDEVVDARVQIGRGSILAQAGVQLARGRGRQRVLYSPGQFSVAQFEQVRKAAGGKVRWQASQGLVDEMRAVKDAGELAEMRLAARLVSEVFNEVLPIIRPGTMESELAAEVEYRMRRKGASGAAFETIVASGPRSALPHARPTGKPIAKNELVVLDLGAILRGYCSDMTRTVFVGRAPHRIREWYHAVLEAQAAAIESLSPGVKAGDVDSAARRVLRRHHLARFFTHSTGHGLGLEVHESPRLGHGEAARLAAGSVVTIEPGVYIESTGGIRIEDEVAVGETGAEVLTNAPKDFLEI
ncbi:MAG: Xaa-Pro peptidase family protein [Candidatus Acidiferrales bacterium]